MTLEEFQQQCKAHFPQIRNSKKHLLKHDSPLKVMKVKPVNLNNLLYRELLPTEQAKTGPWSDEETKELVTILETGVRERLDYITTNNLVKWGYLSLLIPGRTGHQCRNKYEPLVKRNIITKIEDIPIEQYNSGFVHYSQTALLQYQEQKLIDEIDQILSTHQKVTSKFIAKMARKLFYDPMNLALKAAINIFIDQQQAFLDSDGNILEEVNRTAEELFDLAKTEPQQIINDYSIRSFRASRSWVFNFMKRHNYVFRKPHYKR